MDQITVSSSLRAERGKIYDANGQILAESKTVYRVYISPKNIAIRQKKVGYSLLDTVADGLSSLLGIPRDEIYAKAQKVIICIWIVERIVVVDVRTVFHTVFVWTFCKRLC